MIDDTYMQIFLSIASNLSRTPMPGIDGMLATIKASRTQRPRLLYALWEAALAKDQKAFHKALTDSVSHFLKVDAKNIPSPSF